MNYRHKHTIVTLNEKGLVSHRQVYDSVNQAKLANRLTKHKVLVAKSLEQAEGYQVEKMARV
jgi:hypothetical protein